MDLSFVSNIALIGGYNTSKYYFYYLFASKYQNRQNQLDCFYVIFVHSKSWIYCSLCIVFI